MLNLLVPCDCSPGLLSFVRYALNQRGTLSPCVLLGLDVRCQLKSKLDTVVFCLYWIEHILKYVINKKKCQLTKWTITCIFFNLPVFHFALLNSIWDYLSQLCLSKGPQNVCNIMLNHNLGILSSNKTVQNLTPHKYDCYTKCFP